MVGGGFDFHIPILKNDFFENHLESFLDCENVLEKTILNFHFDYLHPSLICSEDKTTHAPSQFFATNSTFHLGGAQRELKIARKRQRTILLEINDIIEKLRIMLIQNSGKH